VSLPSDGSLWRPLVHVEDICRAFLAVLEAPRPAVHDRAFNVGATRENYQVHHIAEMIRQVVAGAEITFAADARSDQRNYRVDCTRLATELPAAVPQWTVPRGLDELATAFRVRGLAVADLTGPRFTRRQRIAELQRAGVVDGDIRRSHTTV
jgi:nucleoside-diphosphate-sugar epimerase